MKCARSIAGECSANDCVDQGGGKRRRGFAVRLPRQHLEFHHRYRMDRRFACVVLCRDSHTGLHRRLALWFVAISVASIANSKL
jgi:hypothetical protein